MYVVLNVDHVTCFDLKKTSQLKVEKYGIWSGTHGAWRKNKGVWVTLEVRFHQRCCLHASLGLYSLEILFVCVISNDKVTDHVTSSTMKKASG